LMHTGEVERRTIRHWILSRIGRDIVVENFDILPITEGILKALSKIRFRNVSTLVADGRKVYDHPEYRKDLKDVLRHLSNLMLGGVSTVHLKVLRGGSSASVEISTAHPRRAHSIRIAFDGRMKCKTLNSFTKFLSEELPIGSLHTSR